MAKRKVDTDAIDDDGNKRLRAPDRDSVQVIIRRQTRISRFARNHGIPNYTISTLLRRWIQKLNDNEYLKAANQLALNNEVLVMLDTEKLLDFMESESAELAAFLLEIELSYGLDTNDWLKDGSVEYADNAKTSSLLSRIYNRYMLNDKEVIGAHMLNDYREWFAIARALQNQKNLHIDFSITVLNGLPGNTRTDLEIYRKMFPFASNVPRFVSRVFVVPQCRWPIIITPYYAGFIVHRKVSASRIAMIYAFALPYPITCLPEYIDLRSSVTTHGAIKLYVAFDEPVQWKNGEPIKQECIEYVDLEIQALKMEKYVLERIDQDQISLLPTEERDDMMAMGDSSSQSASSNSSLDNGGKQVIVIPFENETYIKMRPVNTERSINRRSQHHGIYTTLGNSRLTYNHKGVTRYSKNIDRPVSLAPSSSGNILWSDMLDIAKASKLSEFQLKMAPKKVINLQNEISTFSMHPPECRDFFARFVPKVTSNEYRLTNVEVVADRGEVFVAVLHYEIDDPDRVKFDDEELEVYLEETTRTRLRDYMTNDVTVAIAFTERTSSSRFWHAIPLFYGLGRHQSVTQSLQCNNCVVGYCYEGMSHEAKLQAHVLQIAWSFIHQACGIRNNTHPEIDTVELGIHSYTNCLTFQIDDSQNPRNGEYHHYESAIVQWQMSRGMIIIYSNHRCDGSNQEDTASWCNATMAHYNGVRWMLQSNLPTQPQAPARPYVIEIASHHLRAYDMAIFDKGVFYISSAKLYNDENAFDYIADESKRIMSQEFQLGLVHFAEYIPPPLSIPSGEDDMDSSA